MPHALHASMRGAEHRRHHSHHNQVAPTAKQSSGSRHPPTYPAAKKLRTENHQRHEPQLHRNELSARPINTTSHTLPQSNATALELPSHGVSKTSQHQYPSPTLGEDQFLRNKFHHCDPPQSNKVPTFTHPSNANIGGNVTEQKQPNCNTKFTINTNTSIAGFSVADDSSLAGLTMTSSTATTCDSFKHNLQQHQLFQEQQHQQQHHSLDHGAAGGVQPPAPAYHSQLFSDRVAQEFADIMFDGRNEVTCVEAEEAQEAKGCNGTMQTNIQPFVTSLTLSPLVWHCMLREPITVDPSVPPTPTALTCRVTFPSQFPFLPPSVEVHRLDVHSPWSGQHVMSYTCSGFHRHTHCNSQSKFYPEHPTLIRRLQCFLDSRLDSSVWSPAAPPIHVILKESVCALLRSLHSSSAVVTNSNPTAACTLATATLCKNRSLVANQHPILSRPQPQARARKSLLHPNTKHILPSYTAQEVVVACAHEASDEEQESDEEAAYAYPRFRIG